jgi:N-acetylglucosamine-6-phosphate deacetylase
MDAVNCLRGRGAFDGAPVKIRFGAALVSVEPAAEQADLPWIAPGFVDLQVNGFAGVDFNRAATPVEEIARALDALFVTGVTRLLPTVITAAPEEMEAALRNLARAAQSLPSGAALAGFHVEGPHISPEDGPRGAHPLRWVRPPAFDEFRRWQDSAGGRVRMVTVAPEWPEAARYIERIIAEGVVAAIGHTAATGAQIRDAVSAGATFSTHLGNGAHRMLPRHPNYIWEQLAADRLAAGFIADGIHLDAAFLKAAVRAKGVPRSVLTTDATSAAGAPPGRYTLAGQPIELTSGGRVVLAGTDALAGSALTMDCGLGNLVRLAGVTLAEAIRMATVNPARVGAIAGRAGALAPGDTADLVEFRWHEREARVEILGTWLAGRRVFPAL